MASVMALLAALLGLLSMIQLACGSVHGSAIQPVDPLSGTVKLYFGSNSYLTIRLQSIFEYCMPCIVSGHRMTLRCPSKPLQYLMWLAALMHGQEMLLYGQQQAP